jgi:hypothetical protein
MKRLPFIAKRNEVAIKRKLGEKKKKKKPLVWRAQRQRGRREQTRALSRDACCWNLLSLHSSAQICENASYNFLSCFSFEENLLEEPQEEEEEEETAQEQQGSLRFMARALM